MAGAPVATDRRQGAGLVLLGGLLGFTWAAGLRGFMAQVAGDNSEVSWSGDRTEPALNPLDPRSPFWAD